MNTFGKRLKYAMHVRQVTQAALGAAIGLKQQAIYLLCNEKSKGTKHAFAIARCMNIDPEWLILGSGHPPSLGDEDGMGLGDLTKTGLITSEERDLLILFRGLTKAQRAEQIEQIRKASRANKEVLQELSNETGIKKI